jgi:hypothetical protein
MSLWVILYHDKWVSSYSNVFDWTFHKNWCNIICFFIIYGICVLSDLPYLKVIFNCWFCFIFDIHINLVTLWLYLEVIINHIWNKTLEDYTSIEKYSIQNMNLTPIWARTNDLLHSRRAHNYYSKDVVREYFVCYSLHINMFLFWSMYRLHSKICFG